MLLKSLIPINFFKNELIKDFLFYGISNSVSKFIAIFLTPVLTRNFTPEEFGTIDMVNTFILMISLILSLNVEIAFSKYFYEADEKKKREYFSSLFGVVIAISLILYLLIIPFNSAFAAFLFNDSKYSYLLNIAMIIIPLQQLNGILRLLFRLQNKSSNYLLITSFQTILYFTFALVFILKLNLGIESVFYAMIIANTAEIFFSICLNRFYFVLRINKEFLSRAYRFALPGFPSLIITWFINYAPRIIILKMLDMTNVGYYSIGLKISSIVVLITSAFQLAWVPFFMKRINDEGAPKLFAKIQTYFMIVLIIITFFIIISVKYLVLTFGTQDYLSATKIIGILALVAILQGGVSIFWSVGIIKVEKLIYLTYSQLFSCLALLILGFILTHQFGLLGMAISVFFAYIVQTGFTLYFARKLFIDRYNYKLVYSLIIAMFIFSLFFQ